MTKVSVIIPVYNTASYLKECLDSVLMQSLNDFEIICVNDGSTDSSLELLESYKSRDNRILVINQENKGLAAARNIALKKACGDYILFLDSDDYLDEYTLEELYDLAQMKSLDLIMFKIINFDENYKESKFAYFEMDYLKDIVKDDVFNWLTIKNRLFDVSVTAPAKFYKRSLVRNTLFPEGLIFEDNVFFIKTILKAKRVFFYDKHLYHRRIRSDSITNSSYSDFPDCIKIYDIIGDYLKRIGIYEDFSEQWFNRKCRDVFKRFSTVPDEYKPEFFKQIKGNFSKTKRRLELDGTLKICSERSLEIFNSALTSDTPKEFELSVNLFDLKRDHDKLRLEYNMAKRQYQKQLSELTEKDDESDDNANTILDRIVGLFR